MFISKVALAQEGSIHRIHKNGGRAGEVWGELSATWSRGIFGWKKSVNKYSVSIKMPRSGAPAIFMNSVYCTLKPRGYHA